MKLTKLIVIAFIVILILAAGSAWADAKIALGQTVFNSHSTIGEIGYEWNDWEVNVGLIGAGSTKNGGQDIVPTYSLSKLIKPDWRFLGGKNYYRIGVAYIDGSPLVGNTNFRLGVGLEYKHFAIEYMHYSSAGIHNTNTGIDGLVLRLNLPLWGKHESFKTENYQCCDQH